MRMMTQACKKTNRTIGEELGKVDGHVEIMKGSVIATLTRIV